MRGGGGAFVVVISIAESRRLSGPGHSRPLVLRACACTRLSLLGLGVQSLCYLPSAEQVILVFPVQEDTTPYSTHDEIRGSSQ